MRKRLIVVHSVIACDESKRIAIMVSIVLISLDIIDVCIQLLQSATQFYTKRTPQHALRPCTESSPTFLNLLVDRLLGEIFLGSIHDRVDLINPIE